MFNIQRALVTGGSSGIGRSIVQHLLDDGCEVFSLSRTVLPPETFRHAERLHQIACDLTQDEAVARAFQAVSAETDHLDAVFSNAGFGISGEISRTDRAHVRRQFDLNVVSACDVVRRAVPLLKPVGGRIIFTSSVAGVIIIPYQAFYSATKACLNAFAVALNNELKSTGIRAIAVMPGDTATGFTDGRIKIEDPDTPEGRCCIESVKKMEHDERTGTDPDIIARRIVRIARKPRPKALYGIGALYRIALVLYKVLPVRLTEWIIGKVYGGKA